MPPPIADEFVEARLAPAERLVNARTGAPVSLIRHLYPYGAVRRVMRGPARGCRFVVAPGIGTSYAWGARDAVSPALWDRVRPGMVLYDVGANKGQMALIGGRRVGLHGQVFSFEPAPDEYTNLEQNVRLNPDLRVATFAAAVSDHTRGATFAYDPAHPTEGRLVLDGTPANPVARLVHVPTITLDDFSFDHRKPDVIKIDVEGGGGGVIDGAMRAILSYQPAIYFELHGSGEEAAVRRVVEHASYRAVPMESHAVWLEPIRQRAGAL